jgi:hypothetical protein
MAGPVPNSGPVLPEPLGGRLGRVLVGASNHGHRTPPAGGDQDHAGLKVCSDPSLARTSTERPYCRRL